MSQKQCADCGRSFKSKQALGVHRSQSHDTPWRDKDTLERLYCDEDMTQSEIAERFGITQTCVGNWVRKFDLVDDKPWRDRDKLHERYVEQGLELMEIAEEWDSSTKNISHWVDKHDLERKWNREEILREKYHGEELSMPEIAEELGTSLTTIWRRMNEYGIERRTASDRPATLSEVKGYWQWQCGSCREFVKVHRLAAVAKFGFDAVCDQVVHHKNEIRWDNRPENLALMSLAEHTSHHSSEEAKARQRE